MKPFELNVEKRTARGRAANRRLRREGKVPVVLYGGKSEPLMLTVEHNDLDHHLHHEAFYSHIIKVSIAGGGTEEAVLRDLQRHPSRPFVQHMDLLRVVAGETLRMNVPFHFTGEEECPGVKEEGGIVQHSMNDVEVECLPRDLPEYIEVDCSALGVGDAVHLSELTLPEGVELVDLMHESDRTVVSVQLPRAAIELEEEEAEAAAAEAEEAAGEEGEEAGEKEEGTAEGEDKGEEEKKESKDED